MRNARRQLGFGLGLRGGWMEVLGLPVAILVVLGFVAWPVYSDHRVRARVAQALERTDEAKRSVEAAIASKAPKAAWTSPSPGEVVQAIVIEDDGTIVLRFAPGAVIEDVATLRFRPLAEPGKPVAWRCLRDPRAPVPDKFLPGGLRGQCR